VHGTLPIRLGADDVRRAAAGLRIAAEPERIAGGWEVEDRTRSLYLWRTPSAWYVHYEDASALLGPRGDRTRICGAADPPEGCAVPEVEFVADVEMAAPSARTARRVARATLTQAGFLTGRWTAVALKPGTDAVPCRHDLDTPFDCSRQVLPTRAVMLTRDFGPGTTAARFGVIVGPQDSVLMVTGRLARPA
jgi:hypothetical protein